MVSDHSQDSPTGPNLGPSLPAMFARYKDMVERELALAVPPADSGPLAPVMQYHLGWVDQSGRPAASPSSQGKALRPTLCMFACDALEGNLSHAAPAAASLELIHNFSLIHDDIQDQDLERRHQATVWSIWGIPKALSAGDAMQSLGDLGVLGCCRPGVSPEITIQVSQILTESYLEMIEGQCLDLGFEARTDITAADYLRMIACKTGALIRSSLHIGALLAAGPSPAADAFARFGSYLGRAFQIRDDYLGIWGDQSTTGKSSDSDIRRRKKSFPVVFAFEKAGGSSREDLHRIYRQEDLDDSDVQRVMSILDEVGAADYSNSLTEDSARSAVQALEGVELPAWARQEVEELVDFLSLRQF